MMGITLGDANGIGPEILLKAFRKGGIEAPFAVYGDSGVLRHAADCMGLDAEVVSVASPDEAEPGVLPVVDHHLLSAEDVKPGEIARESGHAALEYIRHSVQDALAGALSSIVTLPVNKESCRLTHPAFDGHTSFIAELCGVQNSVMMLLSSRIACTHVSTHLSLRMALDRIKKERILEVIRLTDRALADLDRGRRIAVAGLNPHAGEHGSFGEEEMLEIAPAVSSALDEGIDVQGPLPPDTVFTRAFSGEFDGVVCMYHDQGHIPMKLAGIDDAVNVTLGLPVIRTSVDHGVGFDIAYAGKAREENFIRACNMALMLEGRFNEKRT